MLFEGLLRSCYSLVQRTTRCIHVDYICTYLYIYMQQPRTATHIFMNTLSANKNMYRPRACQKKVGQASKNIKCQQIKQTENFSDIYLKVIDHPKDFGFWPGVAGWAIKSPQTCMNHRNCNPPLFIKFPVTHIQATTTTSTKTSKTVSPPRLDEKIIHITLFSLKKTNQTSLFLQLCQPPLSLIKCSPTTNN
jgi:hypothetical protein